MTRVIIEMLLAIGGFIAIVIGSAMLGGYVVTTYLSFMSTSMKIYTVMFFVLAGLLMYSYIMKKLGI